MAAHKQGFWSHWRHLVYEVVDDCNGRYSQRKVSISLKDEQRMNNNHLASKVSNVSIATCMPIIHNTKQRMWCASLNRFIGSVWHQLFWHESRHRHWECLGNCMPGSKVGLGKYPITHYGLYVHVYSPWLLASSKIDSYPFNILIQKYITKLTTNWYLLLNDYYDL